MNIYKCPVCNNPLYIIDKTYKCKLNHSYDIAKKRYVNLMLANQGHSLQEGDNKMMIQARSDFLNSKKYDVLLNSIISNVSALPLTKIIFCDVACGDGYYTTKIQEEISKHKEIKTIGIDISKDAIQQASTRRNILKINNLDYVIGNMDYLPFMNDSFNVLLNSFAPINEKEFQRVLKSNGYYFRVLPGKYHLLELKEFLYDEVRLNTPKVEELEGFKLLKEEIVKDTIELNNKEINDLFTMTPYYYKTSYEAKERLKNLSYLKTKIEFVIRIYKCSKK